MENGFWKCVGILGIFFFSKSSPIRFSVAKSGWIAIQKPDHVQTLTQTSSLVLITAWTDRAHGSGTSSSARSTRRHARQHEQGGWAQLRRSTRHPETCRTGRGERAIQWWPVLGKSRSDADPLPWQPADLRRQLAIRHHGVRPEGSLLR